VQQDPKYTWLNPGFEQTDEHPVVNVSWNDAAAFCAWLSRVDGHPYRLPSEAEWEYACRAGTVTKYSSGDNPESLTAIGNVADGTAKAKHPRMAWAIAARDGFIYTAPAGKFRSNAFGLYDMHGNVMEWCQDWYDLQYYNRSPIDNPPGPSRAESRRLFNRVIRGGSWYNDLLYCRSAVRFGYPPAHRNFYVGFRVARDQSAR
jgi:sulfatase modifying factor 1